MGRLERLASEARKELGKHEASDVDWNAVDRALFARIDEERRAEQQRLAPTPPKQARIWAVAASALAVAAAFAIISGKTHERAPLDGLKASGDEGAGSVVAIEGVGEVVVDGKPAALGFALKLGDVIETRGVQAIVERPGKLTFVVEPGSRGTVTHVQGALVLALDRGAVEAQVVPVSSGEAFAVDVGASRVAVHGTHLRVARSGEHVVVDLSEGVVSVGEAPREGATLGSLLTAPGHAEFGAADPVGTLVVTHDPAQVRVLPAIGATAQAQVPLGAAARAEDAGKASEPRGPAPAAGPRPEAHPASSVSASQTAPQVGVNPEATIAGVVRVCMAERVHPENVTVVVSTTLHLALSDDGSVRSARFDPPVLPDVNACAAQPIYKTRFSHGGAVAIPIDLTVPSSAP